MKLKSGVLNASRVKQYYEQGYLLINNFLDATIIDNLLSDYQRQLNDLCKNWIAQGLLTIDAADLPFNEQVLACIDAGIDYFQPLDIPLPTGYFEAETPFFCPTRYFN